MLKQKVEPLISDESRSAGMKTERGFTLLETVIAFMVVMIASLGVVSVFMYSVNYNAGGNNRLQAIAIAQQKLEQLRAAKFNAPVNGVSKTDAILAAGTTTTSVTGTDGRPYTVTTVIDDDPSDAAVDTDTTSTLKGITITVTPGRGGPTWAANSTISAVTLITQRTRMN
ncbi:MAG TPA: prepilin-type N-terminal cleavage/methylation domain-containing protein [Pyrinomonadaceae bacterium]|jgi:type II secretory pathway pseudopilin PulG